MESFFTFALIAITALLIAWIANAVVGWLSGERPRDTGRLGLDTFFRIFAIRELGFVGQLLSAFGWDKLPGRIVLFVGLACVGLFLLRHCHHVE